MEQLIGPLLGAMGVGASGLTVLWTKRRLASGTVETSSAAELWSSMRGELDRLTAVQLRQDETIARQEREIERLNSALMDTRAEVKELRGERDELRRENVSLVAKLHEFELELVRLRSIQAAQSVTTVTKTVTGEPAA